MVSASDDATVHVWDRRQARPVGRMETDYPILAVAVAPEQSQIYTSGIDPQIYAWDVRRADRPIYRMAGHTDTVTSLALHPQDGTHVFSHSMDLTLRTWDIRPYAGARRHDQTFAARCATHHNAKKGLLKCAWNADGTLVSGGSGDSRVHIWDVYSGEELYDLPGHRGCVNAVTFHPIETTLVASGSSDRQIFVGELS
jgi:Prp8 binding protein